MLDRILEKNLKLNIPLHKANSFRIVHAFSFPYTLSMHIKDSRQLLFV